MAAEIRPFCEENLVNAIGGCCGSTPEHIAAIKAMASAFKPRKVHSVAPLMRISGLEPLNYNPNASNMRSTFLMIGERCNVAGSILFKKAIVNGDWDKAVSIASAQVRGFDAVHGDSVALRYSVVQPALQRVLLTAAVEMVASLFWDHRVLLVDGCSR
jgi:hypothetical protein